MTGQGSQQDANQSGVWRDALAAAHLGWQLALSIVGGAVAGYFLDRWLRTRYVFTLGLLVLGIFTAYYSLFQFIRRYDREAQAQQRREGKGDRQ